MCSSDLIIFRDVTSILQDADGLQLAVDSLRAMVKELDYDVVWSARSSPATCW